MSPDCISWLKLHLKPYYHYKNDILVTEGSVITNLIFCTSPKLAQYDNSENFTEIIGLPDLSLGEKKHLFTVRLTSDQTVFKLSLQDYYKFQNKFSFKIDEI